MIFLAGAVTGGIIAYKVLENQVEQRIEEEIASVKAYAKKKIQENAVSVTVSDVKKDSATMTFEGVPVPSYKQEDLLTHEDIITDYTSIDEEDDIPDEKWYEDVTPAEKMKLPFIIQPEDYEHNMLHFDKITIYYYEGDKTFADDQEEIISNPADILGDAHHYFGYIPEEPDLVYIRNYRLASDFELCRIKTGYSESILGEYLEKKAERQNEQKPKTKVEFIDGWPEEETEDEDEDEWL